MPRRIACRRHDPAASPEPSRASGRPTHTITAPNITVQRTPIRSAMRPIMMPPTPTPIQPREPANAGVSRAPPKSAAMDLSATMATHGAPNENPSVTSATVATTQDVRVSMVPVGLDEYVKATPSPDRAGPGGARPACGRNYKARAPAIKYAQRGSAGTFGPRASRSPRPALPRSRGVERGRPLAITVIKPPRDSSAC